VITPDFMKVGWAKVDSDPGKELGLDGCSYVFDGFGVRLCIVRCYSFDPSVVSIGAVGGRQWVAVDRVLTAHVLPSACCVVLSK